MHHLDCHFSHKSKVARDRASGLRAKSKRGAISFSIGLCHFELQHGGKIHLPYFQNTCELGTQPPSQQYPTDL